MKRPLLLVVLGQTAVGKSRFAVRLAKKMKGEIISFDAMQAYKGLPILTNQPSFKERKGVRHHLIGFLPLSKEFSAAEFSQKAQDAIRAIVRKKNVPILVGGSGFYLRALLEGALAPVKADSRIRKKNVRLLQAKGSHFLHLRLQKIDPQRAEKIHPNDAYRILRALEIYESTGRRPSEFGAKISVLLEKFEVRKIGLKMKRPLLYKKINERVLAMMKKGALREVRRLKSKKLNRTARHIIGIKEIRGALDGKWSLEEAISEMQKATRLYAKRQETWFCKELGVRWIEDKT